MQVLKFGAVWCSGCLVMRPLWKELEREYGWLKTKYYDFDQDKEMVNKYNITENLPAFIFLDKDNNEFLRLTGEISKAILEDVITKNKER